MIAKNFLKYAQAMALQMPLPFRALKMLKQSRPTTKAGRAARAARAAIRKAALAIKVVYPQKQKRPPLHRKEQAPWTQLTIYMGMHTLLATVKGHVWVQSEITN